ncbi:hypothetical protein [Bradyrhizobium sp. dw_411]|uniref:hypothetical protein n=1 Tax=Bradyrhizobium sp. dw_411 TaxID=2720082 RepID=UPI001BCBC240|nr:hypothetical protein [Bradyrhizobium sp. dw_411]
MSNPFVSAVLGAIGTALGAWLVSLIPGVRKWVAGQFKERPQASIIILSGLIATAISIVTLYAYEKRLIFAGSATEVYQCPRAGDLEGEGSFAWASFGCVGQVSSLPECQNAGWNIKQNAATYKAHSCKRIGELKYDTSDK